jgi:hypothetical protein
MSMTCLNCTDPECEYRGEDRAACEDHDAEPHTYSIDARDPLDKLEGKVNGVRSDLDDLTAHFNVFHDEFLAIIAAIRRAGEEYGREV